MPRVSPEQALAMAQAAKAAAEAASDTGTAQSVDDEVTANVRRPAGPFLRPDRPVAGPAATASRAGGAGGGATQSPPGGRPGALGAPPPVGPSEFSVRPGPDASRRDRKPGWLSAAILRVGDIPIRAVYGIGAAIATMIIVVLIFILFSGDKPGDPVRVDPARAGGAAPPGVRPKPTPTPIAVPPVPSAKAMTLFTGTGTPIASYVLDRTAGISYPQYGTPWAKTIKAPFSAAQKAGSARQSQALIASGPVPVAVAKQPTTYDGFRKLAAKAAKWSLRYQPAGSKFTWTVSQQPRYNLGWVLGYKVTYVQGGKRHSSQAYVIVVSTAKKKPAMLFATVPDTRQALYHDLNMLFWTARAI
ncbi:hypothetical protein [Sphaerisporangium perillae]|uniref:hypothetical protein n=1 Tax=Sphaerisporangium perillae TaxID=2935860 RepID=UPI00200D5CBC|nr:hypothetical protein [Sphaerisporangium perillae]